MGHRLLLLLVAAIAPVVAEGETVTPGAHYQAGWLSRVFLGAQWRDVWTTPVSAPVLDLKTFDGGIRLVRRGGGMQTKNVRIESAGGSVWVFRSIDKDPKRILDPDTANSAIGDIIQDLTSTVHPLAPLVVAPLLEAAGVIHATPLLVIMPDASQLGEFGDFAGVLGFIEERIEHSIPEADKHTDTHQLFARLEARTDERIDAAAYLKARLMDILVGDWDRHVGQWRWARFRESGQALWRPAPRDRDQAFSKFDGIIPSVSEYYTKQLTSFHPAFPPIDKITFSGRFTDRRFLVGLSRPEWETITKALVARLTDAVIAEAVRKLPPAVYARSGDELEQTLLRRRDGLADASRDFYRLLAARVDVRASEGADKIEIDRRADGTVDLAITAESATTPFFHRSFLPDETEEIRLYTLGGTDRIVIGGGSPATISLRILDPGGTAKIIDLSASAAATATGAPPPPARATKGLDAASRRFEPFRDWGSDLLFYPQLSYDPNRGLVAGARAQLTRFGFGLDPFSSDSSFAAAWSTATNRPRLEYSGDFRTAAGVRALLYLEYTGMDFLTYFGSGNETVRDQARVNSGFYNTRRDELIAHPLIEVDLVGPLHGRAGALLKHVSDVSTAGVLAGGVYGASETTLASGELGVVLDTRAGKLTSLRGFSFSAALRHAPAILGNDAAFTKLRSEASAVVGGRLLTDVILDVRVAGEKNWGRYPFFESAFIGGAAQRTPLDLSNTSIGNLLRGYDLNRFAGDASLIGNGEVRVALGKGSYILPLRYGVVALGDVGRVFVSGESSSKWHYGAGGGLWLALFASGKAFEIASSVNATLVRSDERTSFYFTSGFGL
jgi:hypothetical protein